MVKRTRRLAHAAIIAAIYVVLTHMQNLLIPGSATWALQLRIAECLCVLAFFTPAAIWGLSAGCLLFNIFFAGALPLDFLLGSLATFLSTGSMWLTRHQTFRGWPLSGLLMPGLWNGLILGWELSTYIGGGFRFNALCIFLGETVVLMTLGAALYRSMKLRHLDIRLFS